LTKTEGLTAWKGGGFGMFSTTDVGPRLLGIRITGPWGERDIPPPASISAEIRSDALDFPSEGNLKDLAFEIVALEAASGRSVTRVRVAVWRLSYDPESLRPFPEVVRDVAVQIPMSRQRP
jgi:hypothetical protein